MDNDVDGDNEDMRQRLTANDISGNKYNYKKTQLCLI